MPFPQHLLAFNSLAYQVALCGTSPHGNDWQNSFHGFCLPTLRIQPCTHGRDQLRVSEGSTFTSREELGFYFVLLWTNLSSSMSGSICNVTHASSISSQLWSPPSSRSIVCQPFVGRAKF